MQTQAYIRLDWKKIYAYIRGFQFTFYFLFICNGPWRCGELCFLEHARTHFTKIGPCIVPHIMDEPVSYKLSSMNQKQLTFDSQSCKSCETTLLSNPWRLILMSSILKQHIYNQCQTEVLINKSITKITI